MPAENDSKVVALDQPRRHHRLAAAGERKRPPGPVQTVSSSATACVAVSAALGAALPNSDLEGREGVWSGHWGGQGERKSTPYGRQTGSAGLGWVGVWSRDAGRVVERERFDLCRSAEEGSKGYQQALPSLVGVAGEQQLLMGSVMRKKWEWATAACREDHMTQREKTK